MFVQNFFFLDNKDAILLHLLPYLINVPVSRKRKSTLRELNENSEVASNCKPSTRLSIEEKRECLFLHVEVKLYSNQHTKKFF